MKVRTISVLSLVGVAMSALPALAGPIGAQRNLSSNQHAAVVTQLETQREHASQGITDPYRKGPLLIHNMNRASKLDDLINRVQSGQPVSPDEIDQALQPSVR